jgi:hypothetical protein
MEGRIGTSGGESDTNSSRGHVSWVKMTFWVAELCDKFGDVTFWVSGVSLVAEHFDAGANLSNEGFLSGEDHAKAGEGVVFEPVKEELKAGKRPVSQEDVVVAHDEEADREDLFISTSKVDEAVNH